MRAISDVAEQALLWVQPSMMKQAFELRAGDEVVATLVFQRGTLATAATAGKRSTFKREGFWHPQVTVREGDSEQNVAVFKPNWGSGGTLELADGRALRFGAANFWHSQWAWQMPDGRSGVHFHNRGGLLKSGAEVKVEDAAALPELDLLVTLGWYLLVLYARDSANSAAGSTAVIASSG